MKRLLVFLKYPTPGQVKTRLAASIGPEAAAGAYRACIELTLERLRKLQEITTLYVDPPEALSRAQQWLGSDWSMHPQQGPTLGERMVQATQEAFAGGAKRVVVIGTDSPWLTEQHIGDAFTALVQSEVVIGPAQDGGYYLMGLTRPIPELFEAIPWGTCEVCARTLTKARELQLAVALLPTGYDIDELEDLHRLIEDHAASEQLAAFAKTAATTGMPGGSTS